MISFLRAVMFKQPWSFLAAILAPTLFAIMAKLTASVVSALMPGSAWLAFAGTVLVIILASVAIGTAVMYPFTQQMLYGRKVALSAVAGSAAVYVLASVRMGSATGYTGALMLACMALAAVFLWPGIPAGRGLKTLRILSVPLISAVFMFYVCRFENGYTVLESVSRGVLSTALFLLGALIHFWLAGVVDASEEDDGAMLAELSRDE